MGTSLLALAKSIYSLFESLKEKSTPMILLAWAEGQSYDKMKVNQVLETSM